jgi:Zn-dependent protease/predicted transcriptional regulator
MENSIKLGRIFGINVGVHWSWLFIFLVVAWSFAEGVLHHYYPAWDPGQRWAAGSLIAGVFFLSILAHELAHAIIANRHGLGARDITLFLFGGVSNLTKEPATPEIEFRVAVVGPLTSLALGAAFAVGWFILRGPNHHLAAISANLALINGSLAAFNMLPGYPLDGGRVFRSVVWARGHDHLAATRTAARAGEWIAYGVMGVGVIYTLFGGGFVMGIWFLLIGIFLKNASAGSYESEVRESILADVPVSAAMRTDVEQVAPDVSIEQLVREHILAKNAGSFAVGVGELLGLVTLSDIHKVAQGEWATTSVYRAMTPANQLATVSPSDSIEAALHLLASRNVNQLPVLRGRDFLGVITRADILGFIKVRQDVGGFHADAGNEADRPAPRHPVGS